MQRSWIALALAAALVAACGPSEEHLKQQQAQARQQEWTAIEAAKKSVDAKRAEVASLNAQAAAGPARKAGWFSTTTRRGRT